jgi:hypothetical protein
MRGHRRHLRAVASSREVDYLGELSDYAAEWVRRSPLIEEYLLEQGATAAAEAAVAVRVAAGVLALAAAGRPAVVPSSISSR